MREIKTSVRRLVEFLLRSGDIDGQRDGQAGVEVMWAGSDIHRTLQAQGGDSYQAEVSLSGSFFFPDATFNPHAARLEIHPDAVGGQNGFFFCVEGRADGIIDDGTQPVTIDEIKGVTRDVSTIEEPDTLHEAQALCYAYLYLRKKGGPQALAYAFGEKITVRLTYASMDTGEVRQLEHVWNVPDIERWFFDLLEQAQRWLRWRHLHDEARTSALSSLTFPLTPRKGQQDIMDSVTSAIQEGDRLYAQAPTGSGKTIATLYPALKAMGANEISRIAFLTAKTMTRQAALECLDLLDRQGTATNTLVVTARDKICPLVRGAQAAQIRSRPLTTLCNPVECPLARGHYNAVNDALFELIEGREVIDAEHITKVAAHHHVCPYELQRDAAHWADLIICDYHYAFAPSASLMGTSDEPNTGDTVFLVDEAHNLPDRLREMYSAELTAAHLKELERLLRATNTSEELQIALRTAVAAFPTWDQSLPSTSGRANQVTYQKVRAYEGLMEALTALLPLMDDTLETLLPTTNNERSGYSFGGKSVEVYLALRDADFKVRGFLAALQRAEKDYVTFLGKSNSGDRRLKIFCVNPAHDLDERLEQAKAAVFFSGTLLPMDYHRELLAARDADPTVYAQSSFDPKNQLVVIATDVTARYAKRGPELYGRIATYLMTLVRARAGNYLAYLPSYAMLDEVAKALSLIADSKVKIARQQAGMHEEDRERFVDRFRQNRDEGTSLIGLCVLGGIFGESIDLPGDNLVGVAVVGTGMPPATSEREVIRDYFDAEEDKGFSYAYTYPGMNKVLQAAGRLIRTEADRGVALLLDDRFSQDELQDAFPPEWKDIQTCTIKTLPQLLRRLST